MNAVLDQPRPQQREDTSQGIEHSEIPSTDATTRPATDAIFLPGTFLYEAWLDLLRSGSISYEEFIDWTTPADPRSAGERVRHTLRLLWSGLMGEASGSRP